jgi:UDP-N-acetylglucosamine diphosphorylase/glucosamine-1-phosphate N-acetyltransferase
MNYILFEDKYWENFLPFTYLRFIGDMRVGILKLRQRIGLKLDFDPKNIVMRTELEKIYRERHPDWAINAFPQGEYIFINSRVDISDEVLAEINNLDFNQRFCNDEVVIAFRVNFTTDTQINSENLHTIYSNFERIDTKSARIWKYIWELIAANAEMIRSDFEGIFADEDNLCEIDPGVTAINPYNIWIGEDAQFGHGVILDATAGPIVIDESASVMHGAVIIGPTYIGKKSVIKIGAKIYQNNSIGPNCKIGGEVENTIFQAYSNKQHDGFMGHSFIGEWVNIGADTNNSDLKNTYKPVKVWFYPDKTQKNTNDMFIGSMIGDHTKIGINCSLNTGVVIGFGANLYGSELISGFIHSFAWGHAVYQIDKFLETATIVKKRRDLSLSDAEKDLIEKIYESTTPYPLQLGGEFLADTNTRPQASTPLQDGN